MKNMNRRKKKIDEDDEVLPSVVLPVLDAGTAVAMAVTDLHMKNNKRKTDHRTLPRAQRRLFRHDEALGCIKRDYVGRPTDPTTPLFGSQFKWFFRISRSRFEVLMQDVVASGYPFFKPSPEDGVTRPSLEAKLLFPLKTLAYGVPTHAFCDYFQMSPEYARTLRKEFDKVIAIVYKEEFLRLPTVEDIKNVVKLHKVKHKVDGLFGSLDCSHTYWKNCPKAWQQSYRGKEDKPSIVLEGVADYHLFLWHVSYGHPGSLNDLIILNMSSLLQRMLDGSLCTAEEEAGVVPFHINDIEFNKLFFLVDGIYPAYSRFVKGVKQPITKLEKVFTAWQEGARKDIERAFGVIKITWQWLDRPIQLHSLNAIHDRVLTCVILHNILVTDRVMDCPTYNFRCRYNPSADLEDEFVVVPQPLDIVQVQTRELGRDQHTSASVTGIQNLPERDMRALTKRDRFKDLSNEKEHESLHENLMKHCWQLHLDYLQRHTHNES
jgi:hypothetical protein